MRVQGAWRFILGALATCVLLPVASEAKTCLMLYQLADNNLEFYIRQDYNELSSSPVISNPDLRTWVYYDALNSGGQALPNTVDSSGAPESGTHQGSRYLTYDSSFGKMRVDVELPGEVNSDLPGTVQSFLTHALGDCLQNGHDSLFVLFASQ
jgi:hypothetical protein